MRLLLIALNPDPQTLLEHFEGRIVKALIGVGVSQIKVTLLGDALNRAEFLALAAAGHEGRHK